MITPAQIASHIASQLDGDYDDGIERGVRARAEGTLMMIDLTDDETGSITESFIIAVVAAPAPRRTS